jgi:hypothetical protein
MRRCFTVLQQFGLLQLHDCNAPRNFLQVLRNDEIQKISLLVLALEINRIRFDLKWSPPGNGGKINPVLESDYLWI